jgi:hypothetical protein
MSPATEGHPPGAASLELAVPAPVDHDAARAALGADRERWLGGRLDAAQAPAGMARYELDLRMRVGQDARLVTFHKAALVDVGELTEEDDVLSLEISWRAATMAPLFPVFSGHLTWSDGQLRLAGMYAPPGGSMGMVADRLLLNVGARGTARWLLDKIVDAMRNPRT